MTELLTVEQVAAYLQLNRLTVYRYIREGRLPAIKLGKAYRIRKADVEAFLESQTVRGPVQAAPRRPRRPAADQQPVPPAPEEVYVAPPRRGPVEAHPEVPINPMDWVIRGLH
ncbi:MAG TPA: helix-turn-helix domain-containing protein [bacterium]|nr:helix-turn-helix domain-containing protein [bacterium]